MKLETQKGKTLTRGYENDRGSNQQKSDSDPTAYYRAETELSQKNGIIPKENRIIIPQGLQNRILKLAHSQPQGIVKTKCLLRTKVWWPHINETW